MTSLDPSPSLRIDEQPDGVIYLSGELDMASAPQLRTVLQRLIDSGAQRVILDAAELSFCDSTGLGVFVWVNQMLPTDATLVLRNPTERLGQLLRTTHLDHTFDVR
ncbi:MAG TPA: STAS domain-containing protein [Mycobacteriales bacterium]|nr:STAS domain-containing protein [Mycobacteriales bacterium]